MDHVRSLARAGNCQFRGYRTHEGRRLDKAVAADEAYGVCKAIEIDYIISRTVRRRLPEGSYLKGRTEMENYV